MVAPTNGLTRRDVLKAGLATGAGILLGSASKSLGQTPAALGRSTVNVAQIGVGTQGSVLLEDMLNIPGLRFQAVCDIWELRRDAARNKLKRAGHDPKTYVDFEDMLAAEKDLDAVIVASPDFWHAPHTVACLKSGHHVYCEKMMSNTVAGARSMVAAMRESGKLLQIGHQRRSNPRYRFTLETLIRKDHVCGRMTNASAQWNRAVTTDNVTPKRYEIPPEILRKYGYGNMRQFLNWRWFKEYSGGPISDLGAHQIDVFNWFLGCGPSSVLAGGGTDYYRARDNYDNVMAIFEYRTDTGVVRAFYEVLTTTSSGGGYFENFMGDQGTIKISEDPRLTKVYKEANTDWDDLIARGYLVADTTAPPADSGKVDARETAALVAYDLPVVLNEPPHQPHLENFFNAIRGDAKLNCDGEEAFKSEAAIFKVNDAVAAKRMLYYSAADYTA